VFLFASSGTTPMEWTVIEPPKPTKAPGSTSSKTFSRASASSSTKKQLILCLFRFSFVLLIRASITPHYL
jgi:hypothetical protein